MFSQDLIDRFWSNVDTTSDPDGHWLWTGYILGGYGRFRYQDATRKWHYIQAHRFALILSEGPLSSDIFALHKPPCVTKHCIRHVYPGTRKDNGRDAVAMQCYPVGKDHFRAKLTDEDITSIRAIGHTMTQKAIATQFHVSVTTIAFVQRGITYKHVPGNRVSLRSTRPLAKLTDQQVHDIRSIYTGAYGQASALARHYNVSRSCIWTVTSNKYYQDVL